MSPEMMPPITRATAVQRAASTPLSQPVSRTQSQRTRREAHGPRSGSLLSKVPIAPSRSEQAERPRGPRQGLPDAVKSGIEALSGVSLDHVRVHYDSPQPARLNADAFARRGEIHLAPGQDRYLAHEAWHIVQQAQGRVKPTTRLADSAWSNEDARLEREADAMGASALMGGSSPGARAQLRGPSLSASAAASYLLTGPLPHPWTPQEVAPHALAASPIGDGPSVIQLGRAKWKTNQGGKGEFIGPEDGIHVHIFGNPRSGNKGHLKLAKNEYYHFMAPDIREKSGKDSLRDEKSGVPEHADMARSTLPDGIKNLHNMAVKTKDKKIREAYRAIRSKLPHWFNDPDQKIDLKQPDWWNETAT